MRNAALTKIKADQLPQFGSWLVEGLLVQKIYECLTLSHYYIQAYIKNISNDLQVLLCVVIYIHIYIYHRISYDVPWNHVASELTCFRKYLECCVLAESKHSGWVSAKTWRAGTKGSSVSHQAFPYNTSLIFLPKARLRGMVRHDVVINFYGRVQNFHPITMYIVYIVPCC